MRNYSIVIVTLIGLVACSEQDSQDDRKLQPAANQVSVMRNQNVSRMQHGHSLFLQNCAACHGADAEGAANWSRPDASGSYPAPPLNGTGHAWHHPKRALIATIRHGTARIGGNMPAWQGKLSDQDIDDIITWFQSLWPDELYSAWQRMDQANQREKP